MMEKQLIPAGYKQTEIGVIPEDWDALHFSEIATLKNIRTNPKVTGGGDYCIELEHIRPASGTLDGNTITTTYSSLKNNFSVGDVLFGKLRSYLRKYWVADRCGVCSTEIWVLAANKEKTNSEFIYQTVTSERFIECTTEAYGTHMPRSDWKIVKEFVVAVPSPQEQTAIANALSDVDALIAALEKLINKKSAIKTGAMQQLLTGKKRLPPFDQLNTGYKHTELGEIPGDWEVSTLERVSSQPMQNGLFYEPNRKGKGVYLINVGDMYKSAPISVGELELFNANAAEKKTFKVISGDLFFTRSSIVPSGIAYCNIYESQVLDCELVFDSHLIRLRTNSSIANARYTYLACMAKYARKYLIGSAKTATMTTIDQGALKQCPILLPPLEEQTAIANVLSHIDKDLGNL